MHFLSFYIGSFWATQMGELLTLGSGTLCDAGNGHPQSEHLILSSSSNLSPVNIFKAVLSF